ncbi:ribose 5-phosphate isomerase B [Candidatus Uhrbacteria bacterium]|nr:ribose 5-phosphate isomerase B [Candidatus Uhrbacteria bacterium]
MNIYLGSDHAGYKLKEKVKAYLLKRGFGVKDFGADSEAPVDYPDFIIPAAKAAAKNKKARAIVFGGTGLGECVAANKVRGARATSCYDAYTAKMSREHNDANVLCLGGRTATKNWNLAKKILDIWLKTKFSGEARHVRRLKKIAKAED